MINILNTLQEDSLDVLSKHDAFIYPKAYNLTDTIYDLLNNTIGDIFLYSVYPINDARV